MKNLINLLNIILIIIFCQDVYASKAGIEYEKLKKLEQELSGKHPCGINPDIALDLLANVIEYGIDNDFDAPYICRAMSDCRNYVYNIKDIISYYNCLNRHKSTSNYKVNIHILNKRKPWIKKAIFWEDTYVKPIRSRKKGEPKISIYDIINSATEKFRPFLEYNIVSYYHWVDGYIKESETDLLNNILKNYPNSYLSAMVEWRLACRVGEIDIFKYIYLLKEIMKKYPDYYYPPDGFHNILKHSIELAPILDTLKKEEKEKMELLEKLYPEGVPQNIKYGFELIDIEELRRKFNKK